MPKVVKVQILTVLCALGEVRLFADHHPEAAKRLWSALYAVTDPHEADPPFPPFDAAWLALLDAAGEFLNEMRRYEMGQDADDQREETW